tara:strand:- start:216 stop:482 length:267 start_codon:yes stop_codon:yes gene_type:complete
MVEASDVLEDCKEILIDRGKQYGEARKLYAVTAALWAAYTGADIQSDDVCTMMSLMKVGRLSQGVDGPAMDDTFKDAINYLALARELN